MPAANQQQIAKVHFGALTLALLALHHDVK
jgi:hypothetical protein